MKTSNDKIWRIRYDGDLKYLLATMIILSICSIPLFFFPALFFLAFVCAIIPFLLLKNIQVHLEGCFYQMHYAGKWGWIYFWGIFCFPIAILLLLINGLTLQKHPDTQKTTKKVTKPIKKSKK